MPPTVPSDLDRRLGIFAAQLTRWRSATNLISSRSQSDLWPRHIEDSLQLLPLAPTAKRWLDIGSGAGFPGLVIAIQLYGVAGAQVHCVESDKRKCAFLAQVVRETGIPAVIHSSRAESLDRASIGPIEAVTARALTSLPNLLKLTRQYLDDGAVGLFPLGRHNNIVDERPAWIDTYAIELIRSKTDHESLIIRAHKGKA